jgi:hypothetical protein
MDADLSGKLKSFSDSIHRKFESLGSWSMDHQLMLNSFLQERFLMANLVKSANNEIEKSRGLQARNTEYLRKLEADTEAYKGYFAKIRSSISGKAGLEIDSIVDNIFREIENYNRGQVETISYLGDLQITDMRIQSLIRQKDAELDRLRDELFALNKLKSTVNNNDAHARTVQVLQDENAKLRTEINGLRVERGSSELIASYKQQIQALNERIHELEQDKSNLKAELVNLKNEYEVRLTVQNFNSQIDIKKSSVTDYDVRGSEVSNNRSTTDARNLASPVQKYNINSGISSPKEEGFGIKMVDSKIEPSSTVKTPTYGLTDSRQSGASSSSRDPQGSTYGVSVNQVTSTYQTPASSYQSSSVSGNSGVYGATSLSGSGVKYQAYQSGNTQNVPTYQATTSSGVYQGAGYQSGTGSGSGSGSGSGVYQSGSGMYQSGSGSGVYQSGSGNYQTSTSGAYQPTSGTYQVGASGASGSSSTGYQAGSTAGYQAGSYQPYQAGSTGSSSYQSGTYRTSTGATGATGATGTSGTTGTTGATGSSFSSTYRYEKK